LILLLAFHQNLTLILLGAVLLIATFIELLYRLYFVARLRRF
jgi:hypothetical protein